MVLGVLGLAGAPIKSNAAMVEVAPNVYDIGLRNLSPVTARQNCEQWCWAASIETIFSVWGYEIPQEALVEFLFGAQHCRPATNRQMLHAVGQTFQDRQGRRFAGRYFVAKDDFKGADDISWWQVIVAELARDRPLLAAYRHSTNSGHAVLITHARIRFNLHGKNDVLGITVRDPWPASDNRRMLSLKEAQNIAFVAAVSAKDL